MGVRIRVKFIWIPFDLGGHTDNPFNGMKTTVRWQKYLAEYIECAKVVQWEGIIYDSKSLQGVATCHFAMNNALPDEYLEEGNLLEFLGGYNVLSIGKIINAKQSQSDGE